MLLLANHLDATQSVNIWAVFAAGFVSFFSACVFPVIPVYMGYLAGDGRVKEDGSIVYARGRTMLNTVFFVLGISTVFFILGLGAYGLGSVLSTFFVQQRAILIRIAGAVIILFGLLQLGIIRFNFLNRERRVNKQMNMKRMNPLKAYLTGLLFSFAWTPCTGITLGAVLTMAAGSGTALYGNLLILFYTLGFVIPFLILGLFTTSILNMFRDKGAVIKWAGRIGGILLIVIGILTMTDGISLITTWLS
ncbi:MAG: cytochrome c biogenesis protein CcdA [Eubacteriales bacterium]|nr:cytochrome c biogenesis protein CcdA [Eubacteriales bacterium]